MWSINSWKDKYKLSLEKITAVSLCMLCLLAAHMKAEELRLKIIWKWKIYWWNNISLIIWSAIGWGGSLSS